MTSRDGREHISAEISADVKQAAKAEDVPMWKVVDEAVREYLGLGDESVEAGYRRRIEELEEREERLESEIAEREQELETVREDLSRLREQMERHLEERASYESRLDELLDKLLDNPQQTVAAHVNDLREITREYEGRDTRENREAVVSRLRERATERDVAISDDRLSLSKAANRAAAQSGTASADGGTDELPIDDVYPENDGADAGGEQS